MASPSVQGTPALSSTNTAGTSHTVNLPASIASGELLVIVFSKRGGSGGSASATGWSALAQDNNSTFVGLVFLYKAATGSEGASVTVTTTDSVKSASVAYRISGAEDPATQAPQKGTAATGTSTSPNPPTLSPTGGSKDYLFLAAYGAAGAAAATAYPTNYTNGQTKDSTGAGGQAGVGTAQRQLTAASDDPGVFTITSFEWVAQTYAIHPRAGTSVAVGTVSETDTALTLGKRKQRALGLATETDTAQAVLNPRVPVGLATESDAALALVPVKQRTIGLATETDVAMPVQGAYRRTLGIAVETDVALAMTRQRVAIGITPPTTTTLTPPNTLTLTPPDVRTTITPP